MKRSIIVYGPPQCGKTTNAQRIAEHFGLSKIVDEGQVPPFALTRTASLDGGLTVIAARHAAAEDRRPIHDVEATDLAAAFWLALDAMVKGGSREEDWCMVVCALNVGMVLAERGIGAEYEPQFVAALDGAFRAKVRADQTGAWRFDGNALQVIRAAFAVHDEQILIATKEEMRQALIEVRRRVDAGHVYELEAA